jgi:glutaredoxin 3
MRTLGSTLTPCQEPLKHFGGSSFYLFGIYAVSGIDKLRFCLGLIETICPSSEDYIEDNSQVAKVEVYSTSYCPYCMRAKALLRSKGIAFEEIDVADDPVLRAKMVELAGGRRTVPEIFINGQIIGGCDELFELEQSGELDMLLAQPA